MLSITKIKAAGQQKQGFLQYLGGPINPPGSDYEEYARGHAADTGPLPFWACKGAGLLGLDDIAEAEQVERLAKGFHPLTGKALVRGAGNAHVMGLDMTFSAPKDVSAVFAGANATTRDALIECLQGAAKTALDFAESNTVTRHGQGGLVKQVADAAIAACYTHFASRALDPQLHIHAFMFNVGKRHDSSEWSALEHRPQFERKLATGILFRVELASRLKNLGFDVQPAGPYFTVNGISDEQRQALSTRSVQIAQYMQEHGMTDSADSTSRDAAAKQSRAAKKEPSFAELSKHFESLAEGLGLTHEHIESMRAAPVLPSEPFELDCEAILESLMESQSCATSQEALTLICEKAMGRWSAAQCLAGLEKFLKHENVISLGHTELLTHVFTSKATKELEESISAQVTHGLKDRTHAVSRHSIDTEFNNLEAELESKLGVKVCLDQQRSAAFHIASDTGRHAFVEGWAGTGKTTMLKAVGAVYRSAGFEVLGCCQSAAASQNLSRETGIGSRTIASLLLSLQESRSRLSARSVVVLDEAGMVGSKEFSILQKHVMDAGAKLVCVGDPKQLQPIDAGGIFGSLMRLHGKAEISNIQRQRTDFEPLLKWLSGPEGRLSREKADTLRELPEDARMQALQSLCSVDERLERAFTKWQQRYDYEWMREAVESLATGEAQSALELMDKKERLKLLSGTEVTFDAVVTAWSKDKTPLPSKSMIAATRIEVAELNQRAREVLITKGLIQDETGIDVEIKHRDEPTSQRRFAAGDRLVFTMNDRPLGVANGVSGKVRCIEQRLFSPLLVVELDQPNERGETVVRVPASFGYFDHSYCLTNHKSQGRTFDSAYVLANPSMADREWTYVAASRSRFATTLFVNTAQLGLIDPEAHQSDLLQPKSRSEAITSLASRMRRSRAKGTTLDYDDAPKSTVVKTRSPKFDLTSAGHFPKLRRLARHIKGRLLTPQP